MEPCPVTPTIPDPFKNLNPFKGHFRKTGNIITLQMEERILKYEIKLRVWEREGFVDRFNELARKRSSPLEGILPAKGKP